MLFCVIYFILFYSILYYIICIYIYIDIQRYTYIYKGSENIFFRKSVRVSAKKKSLTSSQRCPDIPGMTSSFDIF